MSSYLSRAVLASALGALVAGAALPASADGPGVGDRGTSAPRVLEVVEDHPDGTSTSSWVRTGPDGTVTPVRASEARDLLAADGARPDRAVAPQPSAHRVYVATIAGGDYGGDGLDQELGWIDEVLDFWVGQSNGTITSFDRAGLAQFALPKGTGCDAGSGLWNTARAAFPTVTFGAGDHLVVLAPGSMNGVSCTFGLGSVGSGMSSGGSISVKDSVQLRGGLAHEIGHNVGLQHADSQSCDPIDSTGCATTEYGGTYDVMGISPPGTPPALRSFARDQLGISQPCEVPTFALGTGQRTATATYDLFPRSATTGTRGLRVTDPSSGRAYYLDWRTKLGQDAEWGGATDYPGGKKKGVTLERLRTDDPRRADLVPASRTAQGDVSWSTVAGSTRTIAGGGLSFTVDSAGAGATPDSTAQVTVTLTDTTLATSVPQATQTGAVTLPSLVSAGATVAAAPTAWTPGSCFRYEWTLEGSGTVGRGATYAVPAGATGKHLTLTVTGQQSGYAPLVRTVTRTIGTSGPDVSPTTPVPTPPPTTSPQPATDPTPGAGGALVVRAPRLVGHARVGSVLAVRSSWASDEVVVRYRWYAGTSEIGRGAHLRLASRWIGERIRVAVTASAPGFDTVKLVPRRRVTVRDRT